MSSSFPLGSPPRKKDLAELAIDTLSTQLSLLAFHELPQNSSADDALGLLPKKTAKTKVKVSIKPPSEPVQQEATISSKEKECQDHPYVITRTQLRIIDETRPMKLDSFERNMGQLMARAVRRPNFPFLS
jgi:hypothetical protein